MAASSIMGGGGGVGSGSVWTDKSEMEGEEAVGASVVGSGAVVAALDLFLLLAVVVVWGGKASHWLTLRGKYHQQGLSVYMIPMRSCSAPHCLEEASSAAQGRACGDLSRSSDIKKHGVHQPSEH